MCRRQWRTLLDASGMPSMTVCSTGACTTQWTAVPREQQWEDFLAAVAVERGRDDWATGRTVRNLGVGLASGGSNASRLGGAL